MVNHDYGAILGAGIKLGVIEAIIFGLFDWTDS